MVTCGRVSAGLCSAFKPEHTTARNRDPMELTQTQTEFVELLEAASSRVDQFVQKVMGPLVEAYGPGCLAPSRLPLDYVLNLAQLYLRLESVRQCEACRSALDR